MALGGHYRTHRLGGMMVAGEVALSLILLVGAGLLSRSFLRPTEVHLGFEPQGVLAATVERPLTALALDSQQHAAFFRDSLERIRNLPGVKEVALTERYPFGALRNATLMLHLEGAEDFRPAEPVSVTSIGQDYFQVMRVHLLEREPAPELFVPYTQQPTFAMIFMVRTDSNFEMVAGAVRSAIANVDKNQPVLEIVAMDDVLADSVAPRRFFAAGLVCRARAFACRHWNLRRHGVLLQPANVRIRHSGRPWRAER